MGKKAEVKAEPEVKDDMVEVRKSTRLLKCAFTDDEKRQISETMAQNFEDITRLGDDLKAVVTDFKAKIAEKNASLQKLAANIRNGYEYRNIPILIYKNYRECRVIIERCDIPRGQEGTTIEDRPMTAEERQMGLQLQEPPKE